MPQLNIILNGENAWPDLSAREEGPHHGRPVIHLSNGAPPIQVAVLDKGMASGKPSIAIRTDLPDGRVVIAETSARLFCAAARAIMARYPDLFED